MLATLSFLFSGIPLEPLLRPLKDRVETAEPVGRQENRRGSGEPEINPIEKVLGPRTAAS
jgi:hypothetical protein